MWKFLTTVVKEVSDFFHSRVFLFVVIALFLYFGLINPEQLKEIVNAIKEMMK